MSEPQPSFNQGERAIRDVYERTRIVRKPISGIVSGYHQLPYILIAPDDEDSTRSIEINGKINVSPKFIISPHQLGETFGDVFDPETFDQHLQGRLFSFMVARGKNLKIASEYLTIKHRDMRAEEHLETINDDLMRTENISTALVFGPVFHFYPVSIDRFVNEILQREFNV